MKKLLAETKGNFMLQTRIGLLPWNRPGIIAECNQTDQFVSQGQVKVLVNNLPEEANDEDFAKFYADHDGDAEAAIENYLHSLSGEEGEPAPEKDSGSKDDTGSTDAAKDMSGDTNKAPAKKTTSSAKAKG